MNYLFILEHFYIHLLSLYFILKREPALLENNSTDPHLGKIRILSSTGSTIFFLLAHENLLKYIVLV